MQYKIPGSSSLSVSEISFGCMSLGNDHQQNARLLHSAFDQGINYFDTADLYQNGFNEETVGRAFKEIGKDVIIATKVGNQMRSDGSGWDWNPTKAYILQAVEKSLKRLQRDHIDLYQLHGGTIDDPIDETIEAFELLKHQGKIRYYGISSIRPNVIREYVKRSKMVSVMMQYSLLDRRPEEECLELLQQNNIGMLARGSLAGGLLINKSADTYLNHSTNEVTNARIAVESLTSSNRTSSDIAIRYALSHPAITSAVVGIRTSGQLQEAIHASTAGPLSMQEQKSLHASVKAFQYAQHR